MPPSEPQAPALATGPVERSGPWPIVWTALLALLGAGLPFYLLGDFHLNLADEGFLWYGVVRVLAGEVPLRDFQAYDPGRYYWCAAWSPLLGSGILGVRASAAIFQALGLFLGALACRRIVRGLPGLMLATAVLALWMFPRHKLFEPALALAAVYVAVRMIESPGPRSHFAAGALTGLSGWFGRNHGLYDALSFTALALYLAWKLGPPRDLLRRAVSFGAGLVLGSAPLWLMMLVLPGFAAACFESVRTILQQGVNVPFPFPWPWTISWGELAGLELVGQLALTVFFLLPFLLFPLGAIVAARSGREEIRPRALLIAATFLGATYMHHVSVRSAPGHLAQCIHPLLLLALALPGAFFARSARLPRPITWGTWGALAALTLCAVPQANPLWAQWSSDRRRDAPVARRVHGEELQLPSTRATNLSSIAQVLSENVASGEALFLAPSRPGLYPVLDRRSPTWRIYFLWPATEEEQRRTIAELERQDVGWALIFTEAIDGRDDLAFKNSNPLVWEFLQRSFEPLHDDRLPRQSLLLRRRRS